MIELRNDALVFRFPEVHPDAVLELDFQRTLRIPDDGATYPLPPGLGRFPLRHVDDHADQAPAVWLEHGGVMLPMYQSEALWLSFDSAMIGDRAPYCFIVKVATGKINAVTGEEWTEGVHRDPQDYMVVPEQPWLDGYCVEKGSIRQFVAMPLGSGYTAEEQTTGKGEHGGLQIAVYPMKRAAFERRFPRRPVASESRAFLLGEWVSEVCCAREEPAAPMGLAPGGRMRQEIYEDPFTLGDWDLRHGSRCFVHLANSLVWRQITGREAPTVPPTAAEYARHGLPWFDYYSEAPAVDGGGRLGKTLKSVQEIARETGDEPLPENQSVDPEHVVPLAAPGSGKRGGGRVREW